MFTQRVFIQRWLSSKYSNLYSCSQRNRNWTTWRLLTKLVICSLLHPTVFEIIRLNSIFIIWIEKWIALLCKVEKVLDGEKLFNKKSLKISVKRFFFIPSRTSTNWGLALLLRYLLAELWWNVYLSGYHRALKALKEFFAVCWSW